MLTRISSSFRRAKSKENGANSANSSPSLADKRKKRFPLTKRGDPVEEKQTPTPEEISHVFKDFAQILHASQRPLSAQFGDEP
jgi:hypothetical protein